MAILPTEILARELANRCEAMTLTMQLRGGTDRCLMISHGHASACLGMLMRFQTDLLRADQEMDDE